MTRTTNARIAGATFLAYIAAGITSMVLSGRVAGGEGLTARLEAVAGHADGVGVIVLLGLVQSFSALVLAVTLYALTREQDPDLALLGLACRLGEAWSAPSPSPAGWRCSRWRRARVGAPPTRPRPTSWPPTS